MSVVSQPFKRVAILPESTFGTAPASASTAYEVEAHDFAQPAVAQEFLEPNPVRATLINVAPVVHGVQGGDGPGIKVPGFGFRYGGASGSEAQSSASLTAGHTPDPWLSLLLKAAFGAGATPNPPTTASSVGTATNSRHGGRVNAAFTLVAPTTTGSYITALNADATAWGHERLRGGSAVVVKDVTDSSLHLLGIYEVEVSSNDRLLRVYNTPASGTLLSGSSVLAGYTCVPPVGGDTTSITVISDDYGSSGGDPTVAATSFEMYGCNGNYKLDIAPGEIVYETFEFMHRNWTVASGSQLDSYYTLSGSNGVKYLVAENLTVRIYEYGTTPADAICYSVAFDAGVARADKRDITAPESKRARPVTAQAPTLTLGCYFDRTFLSGLSTEKQYIIEVLAGAEAKGVGVLALNARLNAVPNLGDQDGLESQELSFVLREPPQTSLTGVSGKASANIGAYAIVHWGG